MNDLMTTAQRPVIFTATMLIPLVEKSRHNRQIQRANFHASKPAAKKRSTAVAKTSLKAAAASLNSNQKATMIALLKEQLNG